MTIPNSVTSIGNGAFWGCSGLADIYSYATVPPVAYANTFEEVSRHCYIHVPAGSVRAYHLAIGWSDFNHFFEISERSEGVPMVETFGQQKATKVFINGRALIQRGDKLYTIQG